MGDAIYKGEGGITFQNILPGDMVLGWMTSLNT